MRIFFTLIWYKNFLSSEFINLRGSGIAYFAPKRIMTRIVRTGTYTILCDPGVFTSFQRILKSNPHIFGNRKLRNWYETRSLNSQYMSGLERTIYRLDCNNVKHQCSYLLLYKIRFFCWYSFIQFHKIFLSEKLQ